MSVWVEIPCLTSCTSAVGVTLHVSVWVEICTDVNHLYVGKSRSTWACELKLRYRLSDHLTPGHAPRERVSWNEIWDTDTISSIGHAPRERVSWNKKHKDMIKVIAVTLHVSVWVEMSMTMKSGALYCVTLHVSVWVEIKQYLCCLSSLRSRSTWACELKC